MKKIIPTTLFVLLFNFLFAQCPTAVCVENGYDLPPIGEVGILVIFAEWTCETGINNSNWLTNSLPNDVMIYQDPDPSVEPSEDAFIGRYFWDASFGQLRVFTDYFNKVVSVPCGSNRWDVLAEIEDQVAAGNPDFITTSTGRSPTLFDRTSGETQHGLAKFNEVNHIIDGVAIIWRNRNNIAGGGDCSGWAFNDAPVNFRIPIVDNDGDLSDRGVGVVGEWLDSKGNCDLFNVEYSHTLFGPNNWHSGGGADEHTLPFEHGNYSVTGQGISASYRVCGWDRFTLGWISPYHQIPPFISHRIGAIDQDGNLHNTDLQVPVAGEQTFVLRDFYETGDAIRIKLPLTDANGTGVKNQYMWFENHQQSSKFDVAQFDESLSCKSPWEKGLYSYIQIGKDVKSGTPTEVYPTTSSPAAANSLGSWLYPLSAEGKFDFVYREDLRSESSTNPGCFPTARTMPIDRAASNDFPNPFTGSHDLDPKLYDLDVNGVKDGMLKLEEDLYNLGWSEVIDGEVVFNWHRFGDDEDAFLLNGNNKIGIGTNPSSTPVYTFMSGDDLGFNTEASQVDEPYENRTIWLNGISVEIIDTEINETIEDFNGMPTTDLVVRVKWNDYLVEQDNRWCGQIVLQDDPNESWQSQVILAENREIKLAQGTSPTKHIGELDQSTEEYLFAEPTVMTIKNNTKLHLKENAVIRIQDKATLVIEDGAEVLLEDKACILVEPGGTLHYRGEDITLNGPDAVIILKGTLKTDDNIDFTFKGTGYADIHETHVLDMGDGSDFVLNRLNLPGQGTRFLRIRENTDLNITDRFLDLKGGKVLYDSNSKISAMDADVRFALTSFGPTGLFDDADLPIGLDGINLTKLDVRMSRFEGLGTGVKVNGVASNPIMLNNQFSHCLKGLELSEVDAVTIGNHTFTEQSDFSVKMHMVDEVSFVQTDILHAQQTGIGLDLKEVNFAYVTIESNIDNCNIGIQSEKSNVLLSNGATVSNNVEGVKFINNPTIEYMLSVGRCRCANIIDNNVGVTGENIILDIDAPTHFWDCNTIEQQSNRFDGNNLIFDICYSDPNFNSSNAILGRGNFWGGQSISAYPYSLSDCDANTVISLDDINYLTDVKNQPNCASTDPLPTPPQFPTDELGKVACKKYLNGLIVNVHTQAKAAHKDLYGKEYPLAETKFQPVSDIDIVNDSNDKCVNVVNISRCITKALENDRYASLNSHWLEKATKPISDDQNQFVVYPNPANDILTIESEQSGIYEVRMFNSIGQSIGSFDFENTMSLDTKSHAKGIYLIEISDSNGNIISTQKLLIL